MTDTPRFHISKLLRLDSNAGRTASRLPNHPEACDVRQQLFTTAKIAQKNILVFLHETVKVDVKPLVKNFTEWENDPSMPPSLTSEKVIRYFNTMIRGTKPDKQIEAESDEREGSIATLDVVRTAYSPTISYFNLFVKAVHLASTVTDASGKVFPGIDRKISGDFVDDFIRGTIGKNPEEEKRFRAFLAGHLFDEIHRTLIQPPNPLVRGLDSWKNHEFFPDGLLPKDIQKALQEMQRILRNVPFRPSVPFQPDARRLQGGTLSPRLLNYFSALGWRDELVRNITVPYAQKLQQVSQSLFAELS